jgi:hypothetical protein
MMSQLVENLEPIKSTALISPEKKLTTFDEHFRLFNDKISIKEKIRYLCLLEENNYFIEIPISSLNHVDVNIKPIKEVPKNFRAANKWKCQMNKKLNFVWKNIDEPYCQDFKKEIENFTSVSKAYNAATKINKENNPEYKSSKSTSIGHSERKKSSLVQSKIAGSSSNTTINQINHDRTELLALLKIEAQLELKESLNDIQQLCVMKKEDLIKKITEGSQQKSFEWAKSVISENFRDRSKSSNLLLCNIMSVFYNIIDKLELVIE